MDCGTYTFVTGVVDAAYCPDCVDARRKAETDLDMHNEISQAGAAHVAWDRGLKD